MRKNSNHRYLIILAICALSAIILTACSKSVQEIGESVQTAAEAPAEVAPAKAAPGTEVASETAAVAETEAASGTAAVAETAAAPEMTTTPETAAVSEKAASETASATAAAAVPVAFDPAQIRDIVKAEAIGEFGTAETRRYGSLRWIERHLGTAVRLSGWPNCPYDMLVRLTRSDGQVFELQPATDSCDNMLIGGNDWYSFNNGGSNTELFDIFNLKTEAGKVERREPLPAYKYNGDNGVVKAVTEYFLKDPGYYVPAGGVALPEFVLCRIADDGSGNITVYGNFRIMVYSRRGRTLSVEAGGNEPGIAYLKKTGDNTYEVVGSDKADDADEWDTKVKKWCNGDKELYSKYIESNRMDSEYSRKWKNYWIYNYVKDNKLPFTETQDGKWDPVPIEPVEEMPEMK